MRSYVLPPIIIFYSQHPQSSCLLRGWFSGFIFNDFSSFCFCLSFIYYFFYTLSIFFCSSIKNRQENEWRESKGLHSGKASLEMFSASALISSKENSTCPYNQTTGRTAFIPSYLSCAWGYNILNTQVLYNFTMLTEDWCEILPLSLWILHFIVFSTQHW